MIDQIKPFIEEYGWTVFDFDGQNSGAKYVVTYFNPDEDPQFAVPIVIVQRDQWLLISTHKLFKFPFAEQDKLIDFLEMNAQTAMVKWFIRERKDETYVNMGCELHESIFNKENLYMALDLISYFTAETVKDLKNKGIITEKNITKNAAITKESLELD